METSINNSSQPITRKGFASSLIGLVGLGTLAKAQTGTASGDFKFGKDIIHFALSIEPRNKTVTYTFPLGISHASYVDRFIRGDKEFEWETIAGSSVANFLDFFLRTSSHRSALKGSLPLEEMLFDAISAAAAIRKAAIYV